MKQILFFIFFSCLCILQASSLDNIHKEIPVKKNLNQVYLGKNKVQDIENYRQEIEEKKARRKKFIYAVFQIKEINFSKFYKVALKTIIKNKYYQAKNFLHLKKNIKNIPRISFMKVSPYVKAPLQIIDRKMTLIKTITGNISPKSIVMSNKGQFWAQNMMYNHTNTVYNRKFELVKTISDNISLADFGYTNLRGTYKGSPVEVAFSVDGNFAYVTNYKMYGQAFNNGGSDICSPANNHDNSFVYKIDTRTFKTIKAIKVGSVPKFVATSSNGTYILVTNWCSYDVSVIDAKSDKEIKRIKLGRYPRGIVMDQKYAYIAIMGSTSIAKIALNDFSLTWINSVGISPRHLSLDPYGNYIYATLNGEGKVAKIDLKTNKVLQKISTGNAPRSMDISEDGEYLYIVNYYSNTLSKIRTKDMQVVDTIKTNKQPIGITYDNENRQIWVACYSGSIQIFQN